MVEQLTPREKQCVAMIAEGAGNEEIAERLGIGVQTVKRIALTAYARLNVDGLTNPRAAAAALWARGERREE